MPVVVLISLSGCGALYNVAGIKCTPGERNIYGGIQNDGHLLIGGWGPLAILCGLIDFPLSLVLDTLTLPCTVCHRRPPPDPFERDRDKLKPSKPPHD